MTLSFLPLILVLGNSSRMKILYERFQTSLWERMNKKENKLLIFIKCSPKSDTLVNSLEVLFHLVFWKTQWGMYSSITSYSYVHMNIISSHIFNYVVPPHFPFYQITVLYTKIELGLSSREVHALQTHPCLINCTLGVSDPIAAYLTSLGPHITWRWNMAITAKMSAFLHHTGSCLCQLTQFWMENGGGGNRGIWFDRDCLNIHAFVTPSVVPCIPWIRGGGVCSTNTHTLPALILECVELLCFLKLSS